MATYKDYNPSKFNDFMTPKYVFEEIKDFIPKDKVILYGLNAINNMDKKTLKSLQSLKLKKLIRLL